MLRDMPHTCDVVHVHVIPHELHCTALCGSWRQVHARACLRLNAFTREPRPRAPHRQATRAAGHVGSGWRSEACACMRKRYSSRRCCDEYATRCPHGV
eukprot:6186081-Prymnesium_polylepis.1